MNQKSRSAIIKRLTLSEGSESKGFTLFISIVVAGTLLLIAVGAVSLSVRQALISSSGKESQNAFYAADTGIECAIYWDVANPSGVSAFATTTTSDISCNGQTINGVGGSSGFTVFNFDFSPDPYCTRVEVTKDTDGSTTIESFGYNTCDTNNPRRVERAVRATY